MYTPQQYKTAYDDFMLFLFSSGKEVMDAVKNDTLQDIGRRRNKEQVYPIYDADCTVAE